MLIFPKGVLGGQTSLGLCSKALQAVSPSLCSLTGLLLTASPVTHQYTVRARILFPSLSFSFTTCVNYL